MWEKIKIKQIIAFLFGGLKKRLYLCTAFENNEGVRAFSSAGSEHLPYKQRVGGSNPSTPTKNNKAVFIARTADFYL